MKTIRNIILIGVGVVLALYYIGSKEEPKKNSEEDSFQEYYNNEFRAKFAGAYTIEHKTSSVKDVEMYALNENGGAKWLWIENDGSGGANVDDEKTGTWTANENTITVNIRGNSGPIIETYKLKENVFYNTQFPKRYLKEVD